MVALDLLFTLCELPGGRFAPHRAHDADLAFGVVWKMPLAAVLDVVCCPGVFRDLTIIFPRLGVRLRFGQGCQ